MIKTGNAAKSEQTEMTQTLTKEKEDLDRIIDTLAIQLDKKKKQSETVQHQSILFLFS
jgi:prefoldin subunit 5